MRIAILSDIHGNTSALDAVLADARSLGAESFWVLGDICAIGPQPSEALERVASLRSAVCTRGNTDRYVLTGDGPPPALSMVERDPSLIPIFAGIAASFAWTRGYLTSRGQLDWLEQLPLDTRLKTADSLRILGVHASPGTDDGEGIHPGRSNDDVRGLLDGADFDLLFVGHTHEAMIRRVERAVVVNLGSVSNPHSNDPRAKYVILELKTAGLALKHRHVPYDYSAFADAVRRSRHPAAEFIMGFQRGAHPGRVPHADHTTHVPDAWVSVAPSSHG